MFVGSGGRLSSLHYQHGGSTLVAQINAEGWAVIISAIGIVTTQIVGMVLSYLRAKDVAKKVETVEYKLHETNKITDNKLNDIAHTGEVTHSLVNNAMGVQLKVASVALRRVANLTKLPEDIKAAEVAERAYQEHESRQGSVVERKALSNK